MRVQMLQHITGFRDGSPWPDKGGTAELPDREASDLILAGLAKEAEDEETEPVEGDPAPTVEVPAAPVEKASEPAAEPIEDLRAKAEALGIKVDKRMKAETIEAKIADAADEGDEPAAENG